MNPIKSNIDGEFTGWSGDTLFKLVNGQIWQQATYQYRYMYRYRPKVIILKRGSQFLLKVEGMSESLPVRRLY